jgi:hypothetical protein
MEKTGITDGSATVMLRQVCQCDFYTMRYRQILVHPSLMIRLDGYGPNNYQLLTSGF